jgi:hypothetical protein
MHTGHRAERPGDFAQTVDQQRIATGHRVRAAPQRRRPIRHQIPRRRAGFAGQCARPALYRFFRQQLRRFGARFSAPPSCAPNGPLSESEIHRRTQGYLVTECVNAARL